MKRFKDLFTLDDFKTFFKNIRTACGTDSDSNFLLWNDYTEQELEDLSIQFYLGEITKFPSFLLVYCKEQNNMTPLINTIKTRYFLNWRAIEQAYFNTPYKPLENYSMLEERTPDLEEVIDTENNAKSENKTSNAVYGFNSSEAVPTSDTDSNTESLKLNNFGKSTRTNKGKETLTRTGNIGTLTTQAMMESEIKLRKFDYWKDVFDGCDKILCLGIY